MEMRILKDVLNNEKITNEYDRDLCRDQLEERCKSGCGQQFRLKRNCNGSRKERVARLAYVRSYTYRALPSGVAIRVAPVNVAAKH